MAAFAEGLKPGASAVHASPAWASLAIPNWPPKLRCSECGGNLPCYCSFTLD